MIRPYQENTIVVGDCNNHLHDLPDESITAVLCDPPYGLAFMGRKWDSFKNNAQYQAWVTEWASELLRVCKPGAVGLFFGGTRTSHRLACGLEDAGWEVYDTLMWVYGSGFPKSHDISKAIDKAAGAERDVLGRRYAADGTPVAGRKNTGCGEGWKRPWRDKPLEEQGQAWITAPATEAAKQWDGWGTALKPAWEPIILARKPRGKLTYAECAVEYGAGALWVDGTRIMPTAQQRDAGAYRRLSYLYASACNAPDFLEAAHDGVRHIVFALRSHSIGDKALLHSAGGLDGSSLDRALCEHLVNRLFPNGVWCGASSWSIPDSLYDYPSCRRCGDEHIRLLREAVQDGAPSLADALEHIGRGQCGPEHNPDCQCNDHLSSLDDLLPAWSLSFLLSIYCTLYSSPPKSQGRWPANVILDEEASRQLDEMSGEGGGGTRDYKVQRQPPGEYGIYGTFTGDVCTPSYIDKGGASRFFYCAKASRAEREAGLDTEPQQYRGTMGNFKANPGRTVQKGGGRPTRNLHPTLKPIALTEYLARLIRPPEAYLDDAVLLVPFCGTGSEIIGAIKAGWRNWLGIEIDAGYTEIAKARIAYWQKQIEIEHAQLEMELT